MGFKRGDCCPPDVAPNDAPSDDVVTLKDGLRLTFKPLRIASDTTEAYERLKRVAKALAVHAKSSGRSVDDIAASYAGWLCKDEALNRIFPTLFGSGGLVEKVEQVLKSGSHTRLRKIWTSLVVGLDLFGDEVGFPYCPFTHSRFRAIVSFFRHTNPRFGIRVHAGENVPRPTSAVAGFSEQEGTAAKVIGQAYELHVRILMASISDLAKDAQLPLRIGHGVVFAADTSGLSDGFVAAMESFRNLLKDGPIPCELNPTSNRMLLLDSHAAPDRRNIRTLSKFLSLGLPVVLCTDDDGVWPIPACGVHRRHRSVAYEYCHAILHGEITDVDKLKRMFRDTMASRFVLAKSKGDNNGTSE